MMQIDHIITRHLAPGVREHLHSTVTTTAITDHLKVCDNCKKKSNLNSFNVCRKYKTEYETKIHEALHIKKINPLLNKQLHTNVLCFTKCILIFVVDRTM